MKGFQHNSQWRYGEPRRQKCPIRGEGCHPGGMGSAEMQDKNCQAGCIYELFGMQGAENIASQLTNKKICLIMQRLIANICGLWSSQKGEATSPCWSSSWGRMHKICREIGGCRVTSTGRTDLQDSPSKKEERGVRGSMKSSWQEPRMILRLCKKLPQQLKVL